jgi:Bacterial SH3 domain
LYIYLAKENMKQCPVCKNTYTDDSLQFCLADGAALFSLSTSSEITQQFPTGTNPIHVNIPQDTSPTIVKPNTQPTVEPIKKGGNGLIIGFLIALLLLVVIGSAGVIGWLLLKGDGNEVNVKTTPTPVITNSITKTPIPNDTENLKEKIANLEKQIQEQKKTNTTVPTINAPDTIKTPPSSNKVIAKVNSPGDGFLALRTAPSAETGERILQIPHGASVTVIACLPKAAGKKGRWCRVDYDGNSGWAYDGFLIY